VEIYVLFLIGLALLLIVFLSLVTWKVLTLIATWQLRGLRAQATQQLQQNKALSLLSSNQITMQQEYTKILAHHLQLTDKAMGLLVSTDPLTFQAVQAMTPDAGYDPDEQFDPSDEAENERIRSRNPNLGGEGDGLSGYETAFLAEEFGIDPSLLGSAD
jgi:hypothetical protein